jgi:hypothetical protein
VFGAVLLLPVCTWYGVKNFTSPNYEHAGDTMPWCTPDSDMLRGIAQL